MDKLINSSEIETHTIILDSDINEYTIDTLHNEGIKSGCSTKDECCCFEARRKVDLGKCQDTVEETIGPVKLKYQARLLKINVILRDVCRGRKIVIGVLVSEGKKTRGFRGTEIAVPGELGGGCVSIKVSDFCFVLPEKSICDKRKVEVKIIAHYTDLDSKVDCISNIT